MDADALRKHVLRTLSSGDSIEMVKEQGAELQKVEELEGRGGEFLEVTIDGRKFWISVEEA